MGCIGARVEGAAYKPIPCRRWMEHSWTRITLTYTSTYTWTRITLTYTSTYTWTCITLTYTSHLHLDPYHTYLHLGPYYIHLHLTLVPCITPVSYNNMQWSSSLVLKLYWWYQQWITMSSGPTANQFATIWRQVRKKSFAKTFSQCRTTKTNILSIPTC